MRFLVNGANQVIHQSPSLEVCNVDDSRDAGHIKAVGVREFHMLIQEGFKHCEHCWPEDDNA